MEVEEDDDVREPLDIVEGLGEFGKDLDRPDGALEEAGRSEGRGRQIGGLRVGRVDDPDGPKAEARGYFPT